MTGAQTSAIAIGHAQPAGSSGSSRHRAHAAAARAATSANAAAPDGVTAHDSGRKIGLLKRMCATTLVTAPIGMVPPVMNGR